MKLYALIGSTAFAVEDFLELYDLIRDCEQEVLVFEEIVEFEGDMYTRMGNEISIIKEEW